MRRALLCLIALPLAAPSARAQGSNPFAVGVDPGFVPSSPGQSLLAHELTHVAQQTGGVQLRVVGTRPAPATGINQAFVYDNGVFRTLTAPSAFETIAKAADINGHIYGGIRRTNGWQPYFWQGNVGDTFGGPLGYVAEFALPQGGVIAMPVDATGNLEPMISLPIGTWRPFDAAPQDRTNAHPDFIWFPTSPPGGTSSPILFGRMQKRETPLMVEWSEKLNVYSSTEIAEFPGATDLTALGVVGDGTRIVIIVVRPGVAVQTQLVRRSDGQITTLVPPPGYASVAAYGVQKGTDYLVCSCTHLLRGGSDLFYYVPDALGNYTPRTFTLVGTIPQGYSIAPPSGPTGRLFSQIKPDFALPATDPTGLPTSLVFNAIYCRTDLDADDRTTTTDLVIFLSRFGLPPLPGDRDPDFNNDGIVNTLDLVEFLAGFGCRPPA